MLATFFGGDSSSSAVAARFASQAVLVCGEQPSYAFVSMPVKNFGPTYWDSRACECALKADGPAGALKLLTRASIAYVEGTTPAVLLNGWVVSHSHQLGEDSVITEIYDDRWALSKYTVFGRMVYDPTTGRHYWDVQETIFNALGFPDCIDTPYGPRFAPCHRYGYQNTQDQEDTEEPEPGYATTRARSWRAIDAFEYLRDMFYTAEGKKRPATRVNVGELQLPNYITWPEGLGNVAGGIRTLKAVKVDNLALLQALQLIARKAGAYDLNCRPQGKMNSVLELLDMNPKSFTGTVLYTPDYAENDIGGLANAGDVIHSGNIRESAINWSKTIVIMGDPACVERFCSTDSSGEGADFLEPAWTTVDELAFKNIILNHAFPNSEQAFRDACDAYPLVYCGYRVKKNAPVWTGTKWAEMGINLGYTRIRPQQLTGYNQSAANPRNWQPREITVEYKKFDDEYAAYVNETTPPVHEQWQAAEKTDQLTLTADSTIVMLPGLRAQRRTWGQDYDPDDPPPEIPGDYDGGNYMSARKVRLNLALEADWPLTGIKGPKDDPNRTAIRISSGAPNFTYLTVAVSMDYCEYLRGEGDSGTPKSRPIGIADKGNLDQAVFPNRATEGSELFTDRRNADTGRQIDHADARCKDIKRIEYNAQLTIARMAPALQPGLACSVEGDNTLPCYGVIKSTVFDSGGQTTTVELGPPDSAMIYDLPTAGTARAASNSGTANDPRTPDDPYTDEKVGGGGGGGSDYLETPAPISSDNEPAKSAVNLSKISAFVGRAVSMSKTAVKEAGKSSFEKRADKSEHRLGNMKKARDQAVEKYGEDSKQVAKIDKDIRGQETRAGGQRDRANTEKNNEGARGAMIGQNGTIVKAGELQDAWMGKTHSGSMIGQNGKIVRAGQLQDMWMGKNTSGTMHAHTGMKMLGEKFGNRRGYDTYGKGVGDLNAVANTMTMTGAANAHDEKNFAARRIRENAAFGPSWARYTQGRYGTGSAAAQGGAPSALSNYSLARFNTPSTRLSLTGNVGLREGMDAMGIRPTSPSVVAAGAGVSRGLRAARSLRTPKTYRGAAADDE